MSKDKEFQRLNEQLEASKGRKILNEIRVLGISYFIFMGNYKELRRTINTVQNPKIAKNLWTVNNRHKLYVFLKEVTRLLHNYLASVKSLVDHTRILSDKLYNGTSFYVEYDAKIDSQFRDSPLSNFVQKLRNYTLHKELPLAHAKLKIAIPSIEHDYSIMLNINKLRDLKGWSKKDKEYIATLGDEVKLEEVVDAYKTLVVDFYKWFGMRQDELHKKDFEEVKMIQGRIKLLLNKFDKRLR